MVASNNNSSAKFNLGGLFSTPGALEALKAAGQNAGEFFTRHAAGDWGEVCPEDKRLNDEAVAAGERLLSAYTLRTGVKVWLITEADRSVTTILLPDEY